MPFNLELILGQYVPYGFGILGILIFLYGIIKFVSRKDDALSTVISGIVVTGLAIGLKIVIPYILNML